MARPNPEARQGLFKGYIFDPEVFAGYVNENITWRNEIVTSGIYVNDPTIADLIGTRGNVGTMPMHKPLDPFGTDDPWTGPTEGQKSAGNAGGGQQTIPDFTINGAGEPVPQDFGMAPLNHDGRTDNTPVQVAANSQTFVAMWRMKAFEETTFRTDLVGESGLENVARRIGGYYMDVWQNELLNCMRAVVKVDGMENNRMDLTANGTVAVSDATKINETTLIELGQKALGDMAQNFSLVIMHSLPYSRLQRLGLVEYNKYVIPRAIIQSVELPTINGRILMSQDRGTTRLIGATRVYDVFMAGRGAFIGTERSVDNPYHVSYDPEKNGGMDMLYTKQGRVIHANGFDFLAANMKGESPTTAEFADKNNWKLKVHPKNVSLAMLTVHG